MPITGYDYDYTGTGNETTVNIPGRITNNVFTGTQTFLGNVQSTSTSSGTVIITGGLGVTEGVIADAVWGTVWNDLADCIKVPEDTDLDSGYAYCFDGEKYYKSTKYMDEGFIGIHSDTTGFAMGKSFSEKQLQIGVAGFILVYVDQEYPVGTPLTITENGYLTQIKEEDILKNPQKVVATFWKSESKEIWGPEGKEVQVNGRMWVKVK